MILNMEAIPVVKTPRNFVIQDLKCAKKLGASKTHREYSSSVRNVTYEASMPKFGRTFFPDRGGGRLARGFAGMARSSSSLEEKSWQSKSSESSTLSISTTFLRFVEACDVVGAMEVDSSGASVKSRPGNLPPSG
jgi:hypothetical protein